VFKKLFGGAGRKDKALYRPRMPDVDEPPAIEDIFAKARSAAGGATPLPDGKPDARYLVVVTPGRLLMHQPCPPAGTMSADQVAPIEKMIPPGVRRNIAAIAYTEQQAVATDLSKAIPFAGLLMGFAYIGHAVWVFEGHLSALAAGCRDADVLLVDGGMVPYLADDWAAVAARVMRRKEIYVHDRVTYKLARVEIK
jgi:hypothetical protein